MTAIFFDLETSDRETIGQILNYAFLCVDKNWKDVSELCGKIRISPLELPDPDAILANRTDVLQHQLECQEREYDAGKKIVQYLGSTIGDKALPVIGFNSSRFDIPYLRTTLIRNGLNPYFGGKIVSRDLLHVIQKLYVSSEQFREIINSKISKGEKLSLALEKVSKAMGLLTKAQEHESRADVVLTIELAKRLQKDFELDVRTYEPYEGLIFHGPKSPGKIVLRLEPNYEIGAKEPIVRTPYALLDCDHKTALWIDLNKFQKEQSRASISWVSAAKSSFFLDSKFTPSAEHEALARKAIHEFRSIKLKGFFAKSTCDIEQDIYRLDFDELATLTEAVANQDNVEFHSKDGKILWTRFRLRSLSQIDDGKSRDVLKNYAMHRYGGKLQLSRQEGGTSEYETRYHDNLTTRLERLDQRMGTCSDAESKKLMKSLKEFYLKSDIYSLLKDEIGL